jgi:hypothetical protein
MLLLGIVHLIWTGAGMALSSSTPKTRQDGPKAIPRLHHRGLLHDATRLETIWVHGGGGTGVAPMANPKQRPSPRHDTWFSVTMESAVFRGPCLISK